jgi:hypothetical protein
MRIEKAVDGLNGSTNINEQLNYNRADEKKQLVFNLGNQPARITTTVFDGQDADGPTFRFTGVGLACDECNLPLRIYGENYVESHTDGRSSLLKALCDSHAAEFLGVQK